MFDPSIPNFSPATFAVQEGGLRAIWSESSWRFRVSTIARSRPTATESRRSGSPYKASATTSGSAGRGNTHSRPSAACGGATRCGPTAAGLAASVVSGRPTSGGDGGDTGAGAASTAAGRGRPPAGPPPGSRRRRHAHRDSEEAPAPRAEAAPGHDDDARLLERAPLERGRGEPLGQRHPDVHRGTRRLGLEPLGAERGQHRVAPLPELR